MGQCTHGDIKIEFQTVEDADYVFNQLKKITELTFERIKTFAYFDLQNSYVDGTIFKCNIYSNRIPNGEFQIEQVIEQIKIMVLEDKIKPPHSFISELLIQHQGWSLDENDFKNN